MRPTEPTLAYLIQEAIRSKVATIHTTAVGTVQKYNRAKQTATVQLVVQGARKNPRTGERSYYVHRPLVNVPVLWPGGGGHHLVFDLAAGDTVLVVFNERDMSRWKATAQTDVQPVDPRRHDLADGFAIPMVHSPAAPLDDSSHAEGAAVFSGDDIRLGSSDASDFVALAGLVLAELQKVTTWMTSMKTIFDAHVHAGAGVPTVTPAPSSVSFDEPASTTVRST